MVSKTHAKRRQDIKTKLMAAIAMLLVSSIMMVSSTYAWFTLSTAPEVTGITTAVGANGNLEMRLQPLDGNLTESAVGDSLATQDIYWANTTWGNLVDLSNTSYYGFNQITLNPAALNTTTTADGLAIQDSPLAVPVYGADGRVSDLDDEKTFTGVFDKDGSKTFIESATVTKGNEAITGGNGVRAIGVSSGMSDRQLAYRAAVSAASTATGLAKSVAAQSLNANGARLADIAIKKATSDGNEIYFRADIQALYDMTETLVASGDTKGSIDYIVDALIKYSLATELANASDAEYTNISDDYEQIGTLTALKSRVGATNNVGVSAAITKLEATITAVNNAKSLLNGLLTGANESRTNDYKWSEFEKALFALADPDQMQVNRINVGQIKGNWASDVDPDGAGTRYKLGQDVDGGTSGYVYELDSKDGTYKIVSNMSRLVDAVLNDGLQLILASGAGVFADIADFCGDYTASVTLSQISYGGMTVKNLDAKMSTDTTYGTADAPLYLEAAKNDVPNFYAGSSNAASQAMSDFYGYIIDLAFRTNATGSKLMLQQDAVDRVYSDNTANEDTFGGGAYMSFASGSSNFGDQKVKELMENIRVVFFDTTTKVIKGYARLDVATAEIQSDTSVKMKLRMCDKDGVWAADQSIMELNPNTAHKLSVMVYLDGESITNADVAYDAEKSLVGSMNLQFSSNADLVPMDYTDLVDGDENTEKDYGKGENGNQTPAPTPKKITVTGATDVEAYYVEVNGQKIVIVTGAAQDATVTINSNSAAYAADMGGKSGHYVVVTVEPTEVVVTVTPATQAEPEAGT